MLVAIVERALTKLRISLSGYRLSHAAWKLTHSRRLREDAALGPTSCTASETSTMTLAENPMADFLCSKDEHDDFVELRRRAAARIHAALQISQTLPPKPRSRSLDDLPPEILIKIWKYVAETPGWFHVKYHGGKIHAVNIGGHREHWVNRRWYFADEFRASLSRHPVQETMRRYAARVLDTTLLFRSVYRYGVCGPLVQTALDAVCAMLEWSNVDAGCEPFRIRLQGVDRFPIVRPKIDWFFFENYATALAAKSFIVVDMPPDAHMLRVSTVVFKLKDLYRGICLSLRGDGRPMEPWRVDRRVIARYIRRMSAVFGALVDYTAQLQKCMILVGELRPCVQPCDLQEISVEWVSPENESSINTQRGIITSPEVSPNNRAMIRFVHQELEYFAKLQREWRNDLLRSPEGQVWLADIRHEKDSMRSEWLASTEGRIWRENTEEGKAWLRTASGYWWLASIPGSPWLETPQGLQWLDSEAGALFLQSTMARVWAGVDNSADQIQEATGKLPRKKWFDIDKGRAWVAKNCPDYRVPIVPEPPWSEDTENSGLGAFDRSAQFFVRPPPHWGFVMAPAQVGNRPRVETRDDIGF
ncbi:hypothetical protein GGR58DRAFT_230570 [Xylaria digitata]|nr:hypothetical protein GGR58DRAFT_230570 [Xylaria digitata]